MTLGKTELTVATTVYGLLGTFLVIAGIVEFWQGHIGNGVVNLASVAVIAAIYYYTLATEKEISELNKHLQRAHDELDKVRND